MLPGLSLLERDMPKAEPVADIIDETETTAPPPPTKQSAETVKVRVTKLGDGKVSTGRHIAMIGDEMHKANDILELPLNVAQALEKVGFAEIQ